MPIHSMWRCIITSFYIQCGCEKQSAVVNSLNHDTTMSFGLCLTPIFQNLAPTCTGMYLGKGAPALHLNAHPQHAKVHTCFIYIQYGCGKQLVVVHSINHDTTMPIGLCLTPIYKNLDTTCTSVYLCKGAPECPSTACEGAQSLYIHPIWMWEAVIRGLQPQPWHHMINCNWAPPYPNFPKFGPHLHT